VSPLLDLDRSLTTWVAAQCSSLWLQWPLVIATTAGVGATVWYALALMGWAFAPRLVPRRAPRLPSEDSPTPGSVADRRRTLAAALPSVASLRAACWRAILALSLSLWLVDGVAKPLVRRDRPFVNGPQPSTLAWRPTTSSFPSGHAASATAGALTLARAFPPAAAPLTVLAGLIVLSRVGLGVHYVGDVLGGVLLGLAVAVFVSPRPPPHDRA
jgi:membrane-associated phospholipid phosphatase